MGTGQEGLQPHEAPPTPRTHTDTHGALRRGPHDLPQHTSTHLEVAVHHALLVAEVHSLHECSEQLLRRCLGKLCLRGLRKRWGGGGWKEKLAACTSLLATDAHTHSSHPAFSTAQRGKRTRRDTRDVGTGAVAGGGRKRRGARQRAWPRATGTTRLLHDAGKQLPARDQLHDKKTLGFALQVLHDLDDARV